MKHKRLSFLITMCSAMVVFCASGCKHDNPPVGTVTIKYTDEYYKTLSVGIKGEKLKTELRELNTAKKVHTIPYNTNSGATYMGKVENTYALTDVDPNDPTKIIGFYDNVSYPAEWDGGKTWNREHVWPDSRGGKLVENDVLMTRPCKKSINSARNNRAYGTSSLTFDPGQYGYYNYRGIAARIIFYCALIEPKLTISDNVFNETNNMAKLSLLLQWNKDYPPSESETAAKELKVEQNRNKVAQELQGNRNPFVDHPEFVDMIWGN